MHASEAARISINSKEDKFYLILKLIEQAAEKGLFRIVYPGTPDSAIKKLENLGYKVKLSSGRYADTISWGDE